MIYISPDGTTIKGLPYELGLIDVVLGEIVLTEDGNNFADIYSPMLDGYLRDQETPKYQFSDEELTFLYAHIKQKITSEPILFNFILSQIERGVNTPNTLNNNTKPFLEKNFSKKEEYSTKAANSLRAGVTSRMVELKLVKIKKLGANSFYEMGENGRNYLEV